MIFQAVHEILPFYFSIITEIKGFISMNLHTMSLSQYQLCRCHGNRSKHSFIRKSMYVGKGIRWDLSQEQETESTRLSSKAREELDYSSASSQLLSHTHKVSFTITSRQRDARLLLNHFTANGTLTSQRRVSFADERKSKSHWISTKHL